MLDTWFSSGLWPFSTLGWPENTADLKKFYPTSVLVTGFDIIFFWVARMIMMGLEFMGEVPFRDVYIHGLVRDEQGQKMSKSLGNVIDPLEVIDEFGADALRFALVAFAAQGRDMRLSEERIEGYRRFVNKIWNAHRFALMNLEDFDPDAPADAAGRALPAADRWILGAACARPSARCASSLDEYQFNDAASALYQFTLARVLRLVCGDGQAARSMRKDDARRAAAPPSRPWCEVLDAALPPPPPVHALPERGTLAEAALARVPRRAPESLVIAAFPGGRKDPRAGHVRCPELADGEGQGGGDRDPQRAGRDERAALPPIVAVFAGRRRGTRRAGEEAASRRRPGGSRSLQLPRRRRARPPKSAAAVAAGLEILLPLAGLMDLAEEEKRLRKEMEKLVAEIERVEKKLANPQFVDNAPEEVVAKERAKADEFRENLDKMRANLGACARSYECDFPLREAERVIRAALEEDVGTAT